MPVELRFVRTCDVTVPVSMYCTGTVAFSPPRAKLKLTTAETEARDMMIDKLFLITGSGEDARGKLTEVLESCNWDLASCVSCDR